MAPVGAGEQVGLRVTAKRDDDRATVKVDGEKATVSIRSPFGISTATIERVSDEWPNIVVLHLHLKGLENFQIAGDRITLEGAVSLQGGKTAVRIGNAGRERATLHDESPLSIDVQTITSDGKPAKDVLQHGDFFEIVLPRKLFESNPKSIQVSWIDFYRN